MSEEIQTAEATTILEIITQCPYCGEYQDQREILCEHLDHRELRAESCEAEVRCSDRTCNKVFIVTKILY